jgi:hypothetical protein
VVTPTFEGSTLGFIRESQAAVPGSPQAAEEELSTQRSGSTALTPLATQQSGEGLRRGSSGGLQRSSSGGLQRSSSGGLPPRPPPSPGKAKAQQPPQQPQQQQVSAAYFEPRSPKSTIAKIASKIRQAFRSTGSSVKSPAASVASFSAPGSPQADVLGSEVAGAPDEAARLLQVRPSWGRVDGVRGASCTSGWEGRAESRRPGGAPNRARAAAGGPLSTLVALAVRAAPQPCASQAIGPWGRQC